MISYFRSIRSSRLFLLVLLFLALQLPFYLIDITITAPEVLYMLMGERMSDGHALYSEIYDHTAPLAATIYWLIDLTSGRSFITYRIAAIVLLLIQAIFLNLILNRQNVYATKSYLPALLYLVFGSITFEFTMLSPLLIGNTFIILSIPYFITVSKEGFDYDRLFVGGFVLGLAALCYLPLAAFLVLALFAVVLFASNTFRSSLLVLCGFAFPYAVTLTYFFYNGALGDFLEMHILRPWQLQISFTRPPADLAKLMVLPFLVLALSLLNTLSLPQRLVYQAKIQQVMWVWLIVSVVMIFTRDEISSGTFVLLLPPLAYFGEYFFKIEIKKWLLNVVFLLLLAGVIALRYREILHLNQLLNISSSVLIIKDKAPASLKGSVVLVLGKDASYYLHNKIATPYINWELAQRHFGRLNEYEAVYTIAQHVKQEQPTYIIDQNNLMPALQTKLPFIFRRYELTDETGIYRLK